jgi:hypothetical protein
MPGTGSTDAVGRTLGPIAAAVQPHRLRAVLADTESDESLIAKFLLGYGDRTRVAYLADLRDFHAWCARIGIGLLAAQRGHIEAYIRALEQAGRSRATVAGGWPLWPASTATQSRRERSSTPPPPTFVAPRYRVIRRRSTLTRGGGPVLGRGSGRLSPRSRPRLSAHLERAASI